MANSATRVLPAPVGADTITDLPSRMAADRPELEVVQRKLVARGEGFEQVSAWRRRPLAALSRYHGLARPRSPEYEPGHEAHRQGRSDHQRPPLHGPRGHGGVRPRGRLAGASRPRARGGGQAMVALAERLGRDRAVAGPATSPRPARPTARWRRWWRASAGSTSSSTTTRIRPPAARSRRSPTRRGGR